MTAAEMTDALVQINDRLADAASAKASAAVTFYCECGNCLALDVPLSRDEHDAIRAREDLIFAPGHDAPRRYGQRPRIGSPANGASVDWLAFDSGEWRGLLTKSLQRVAARV